jgi:hypothetical protein
MRRISDSRRLNSIVSTFKENGMTSLTQTCLTIIALIISALPSYAQESKSKPILSEPVPPPAPSVEYNPGAWKEYSSERGRFTILFPGTPVEDDNSSMGFEGRKSMLTTTAVYAVFYQDWPAEFQHDLEKEGSLRQQFFDKGRDAVIAQLKAKPLSEADISLDGHPGRLTKMSVADATIIREKRFVVGKRFYQIMIITPRELLAPDGGQFDESRATKFLDSFKLHKAVSVEAEPDAWKVYSSRQGRFAITFPGMPSEEDKSYDTPLGRSDARDYVLMASAEYRVSYTDFVVDLEKDPIQRNRTLDSIRDHVVANFKSKVSTENAITLAGHPGRMITLTAADGSITRTKSYTVGKRLYQIMVTTSKSVQSPDDRRFEELWATRFFDSFKLAEPEH